MSNKKKAFTLIELLVVIAIIGILATVSVIALQNARAKSRDAKRAGDMKQIQTALELFFNDKNRYPTADEFNSGSIFSTSTSGTSTYMQVVPSAPTPVDGNCTSIQNTFSYSQTENGNSYTISLCLGNTTGTLDSGPKCLTSGGILDADCSVGDNYSCPGLPVVQHEGGLYNHLGTIANDGGYYRTVQIGNQCWLRDNINVGTMLCPGGNPASCATFQGDAQSQNFQKYCYNNDSTICNSDGALYMWHTAMALPQSCVWASYTDNLDGTYSIYCSYTNLGSSVGTFTIQKEGHQGICPSGWHIPSDNEMYILENSLTDSPNTCDPNRTGAECANAGTKMMVGGSSQFNSIMTGYVYNGDMAFYARGGMFGQVFYWTTSFVNNYYGDVQSVRALYNYDYPTQVVRSWAFSNNGFSVRCIKD